MLRFRLGRIPVEVHFSHLLVAVLFALSLKPTRVSSAWPARVLTDPHAPGYPQALGLYVAGWVAVFFISILVHELGHAVVSRMFGYRPVIRLLWLGGHTDPNPNETIPWNRDVALTLAGPFFGLSLAVLGVGFQRWLGGSSEVLSYFLKLLVTLNLGWTVLNLLPVPPLDGGRVSSSVLSRLFGRRGFLFAQVLAFCIAVGVIGLALWSDPRDNLYIVLFFATFGFRAGGLISAYFRGEAPAAAPIHPHEALLGEALSRLQANQVEDTKGILDRLLVQDLSLPLRSRAHHLRGWVAIKEGAGREALDHFSQVQSDRVEPQAVAAAFCLVGDDLRSLPLWEEAYAQTKDRTILHEWAGAMIRTSPSELAERALRMPGVDAPLAFQCACQVLIIRGRFQEAAELGGVALDQLSSPTLAYDAACAWAQAGHRDRALSMLRRAQALGLSNPGAARADPDLLPLHGWAPFEDWLTGR